jgi:glycosyltransferase involved in cell wall biosynthesis
VEKSLQISREPTVGFNVLGYVSAGIGLGVTARNIILSLINRNFPVRVFDIDVGLGRSKQDRTFESITVQSVGELPYAINLFILDMQGLWRFLSEHPDSIDQSRFNAALVLWELPILPSHWKAALECFDILLAPSEFIQNTFNSNLSHVRTVHCEHPLYLPEAIVASRKRFSIPENKVAFVTSFDPHSDAERKNPFAAVEAFKRIAGDEPRAHMVIKVNDPTGQHPIIANLKDRCANYRGIQLLTDKLSYEDVLALYASSDAFVSLHRSEGVGLGLMECMMLGKPVIATGWSGNTSFMDQDNSCLVSYELIKADGSIDFYKKQFLGRATHWADPNIDEAVVWMKRLVSDPGLRIAKGQRAAESIGRYQERARQVKFAEGIIAEWQQRATRSKSSKITERATVFTRRSHFRFRTQIQRLRERTQEELDRHLLWRFKSH